jgi:tRNA threonylcarbamoyladenosine biosynthesis protein TsaB
MIDALLSEADADIEELGGILALRGPGSFTGLRVGLATCLGLHQALDAPATTLTTFETLASVSPERDLIVLAVVESIRRSWLVQRFRAADIPEPLSEPRSVSTAELVAEDADLLIGFGLSHLSTVEEAKLGAPVLDAPPLAGPALRLLGRKRSFEWDPSGLVRPLYLQAVSATPPAAPAR